MQMGRTFLGGGLALAALSGTIGDPGRQVRVLRPGVLTTTGAAADPTVAVVAVAALLAWAGAAWLLIVAGMLLLGRSRGRCGRLAAGISRVIAPAVVRRGLAVGLGLAVLTGTGPPGAFADSGTPPPEPTIGGFDWPSAAAPRGVVVVAPGDSLWRLAERALPGDPSDRQVAASWPAWWSANRDLIGPDPHLLRPGTPLVPPDSP